MSTEREMLDEDAIRVMCRFRPLSKEEERAGSNLIVKFPSENDNHINLGVCIVIRLDTNKNCLINSMLYLILKYRVRCTSLMKYFNPMPVRKRFTMKLQKILSKVRQCCLYVLYQMVLFI